MLMVDIARRTACSARRLCVYSLVHASSKGLLGTVVLAGTQRLFSLFGQFGPQARQPAKALLRFWIACLRGLLLALFGALAILFRSGLHVSPIRPLAQATMVGQATFL